MSQRQIPSGIEKPSLSPIMVDLTPALPLDKMALKRFIRQIAADFQVIGVRGEIDVWFLGFNGEIPIHRILQPRKHFPDIQPLEQNESGTLLRFKVFRRGQRGMKRLEMVIARDGNLCAWCSKPLNIYDRFTTVDHIIPRAKGGKNEVENFLLSCSHCNHARQTKSITDWLQVCLSHKHYTPNFPAILAAIDRLNIKRPKFQGKTARRLRELGFTDWAS